MIVKLYRGELYPFYSESILGYGDDYEIPDQLWERYRTAKNMFVEVLDELEELLDSQ